MISSDTDPDLMLVDDAAADLGIEPKRLRGYMLRNGVGDPIGDGKWVYRWSLETTRKRLRIAESRTGAQP